MKTSKLGVHVLEVVSDIDLKGSRLLLSEVSIVVGHRAGGLDWTSNPI